MDRIEGLDWRAQAGLRGRRAEDGACAGRRREGLLGVLRLGPHFPQKRLRRVHGVQGRHEPFEGFRLIERFSEDIDLILDWRLLGYGENEPWEPRSNSAQERFKADSIECTNAFLVNACSR